MLQGDARMRDRLRLRRPRIKRPTINQIIPNAMTVAALCAGLSAIRFALLERWRSEEHTSEVQSHHDLV